MDKGGFTLFPSSYFSGFCGQGVLPQSLEEGLFPDACHHAG